MQSIYCEAPDWMKHTLESKLSRETSIISDVQMTPDGRKQRRTKAPLDESERGWKSWLKPQRSKNEDHGIWSHHFMSNRWWKQCQTLFFWAPKSLQMVIAATKLKDAYSLEEKLWPTWIAYSKAETLLCWLRSVQSRLWFFPWSCMDVRVGLWRRLSTKELMLLNCGVGEDSWESLGLQGNLTSPF